LTLILVCIQVIAQYNWDGGNDWKDNPRPDGGPKLKFDFEYSPKAEPRQYVNATVTQLFYDTNMYHDLLYRYGFDEASGNFQQYNFGKGGSEEDGVIIDAQDGGGLNNANFLTVGSFLFSLDCMNLKRGCLAPRRSKWPLPHVYLEYRHAVPGWRTRRWDRDPRVVPRSLDSSHRWSQNLWMPPERRVWRDG
jgi:hypothetical protein